MIQNDDIEKEARDASREFGIACGYTLGLIALACLAVLLFQL